MRSVMKLGEEEGVLGLQFWRAGAISEALLSEREQSRTLAGQTVLTH